MIFLFFFLVLCVWCAWCVWCGGSEDIRGCSREKARGKLKSSNPLFMCFWVCACVWARNNKRSQHERAWKRAHVSVWLLGVFFWDSSGEDGDTWLCLRLLGLHLHLIQIQNVAASEGLPRYTKTPPKLCRCDVTKTFKPSKGTFQKEKWLYSLLSKSICLREDSKWL